MTAPVSLTDYRRRNWVAPFCDLHDPTIPAEEKVQTLCHCWDRFDADDPDALHGGAA